MNSSEETRLAADLRQLVAGRQFAPDVEAIEHRGRRQRRRALAIRVAAGAGVLGLGVAGVAMASGLADPRPAGTPGMAAGPVHAQTVAYVRQQISAALTAPGYLIKAVDAGPPGGETTVSWTDPATGNTMQLLGCGAGKTTYWQRDYYRDRVLHWQLTQVFYGSRTWSSFSDHASGPVAGPVPSGPVGGDYTPASTVRLFLSKGNATIVGHPVVNGHHTIELSVNVSGHGAFYIWADSRTYQVVRVKLVFPAPVRTSTTIDYYWMPSTESQAKLINHPQIPAGFTQVPADGSIHVPALQHC